MKSISKQETNWSRLVGCIVVVNICRGQVHTTSNTILNKFQFSVYSFFYEMCVTALGFVYVIIIYTQATCYHFQGIGHKVSEFWFDTLHFIFAGARNLVMHCKMGWYWLTHSPSRVVKSHSQKWFWSTFQYLFLLFEILKELLQQDMINKKMASRRSNDKPMSGESRRQEKMS